MKCSGYVLFAPLCPYSCPNHAFACSLSLALRGLDANDLSLCILLNCIRLRCRQAKLLAAAKFNALSDAFLGMKRAGKHDEEALKLSMKVLELNPEFYTAWNFRREFFSAQIKNCSGDEVKKVVTVGRAWHWLRCDERQRIYTTF